MTRLRAPDPPKEPGRCAHCGCTEASPCKFGRYARCSWFMMKDGRMICSNRDCVQAEIDRLFAELEEKQREMTAA